MTAGRRIEELEYEREEVGMALQIGRRLRKGGLAFVSSYLFMIVCHEMILEMVGLFEKRAAVLTLERSLAAMDQ